MPPHDKLYEPRKAKPLPAKPLIRKKILQADPVPRRHPTDTNNGREARHGMNKYSTMAQSIKEGGVQNKTTTQTTSNNIRSTLSSRVHDQKQNQSPTRQTASPVTNTKKINVQVPEMDEKKKATPNQTKGSEHTTSRDRRATQRDKMQNKNRHQPQPPRRPGKPRITAISAFPHGHPPPCATHRIPTTPSIK